MWVSVDSIIAKAFRHVGPKNCDRSGRHPIWVAPIRKSFAFVFVRLGKLVPRIVLNPFDVSNLRGVDPVERKRSIICRAMGHSWSLSIFHSHCKRADHQYYYWLRLPDRNGAHVGLLKGLVQKLRRIVKLLG
jgi:hypothetical protein